MDKIKIFFFPFAGGSARVYNNWKKSMPAEFEIIPVEMKGRGNRFQEKICQSMDEMVDDAFQQVKDQIQDGNYAIFGHSMGAIVSQELSYRIIEAGLPAPMHLFLSGRGAPHVPYEDRVVTYLLPDDEFKERLHEMGGTPREILENPQLMDIFVPILRQDFKNCETYQHQARDYKFDFGITVFTGMEEELSEEQIEGWHEYSNQKVETIRFPGDHFFLFDHTLHIMRIICRTLYAVREKNLDATSA